MLNTGLVSITFRQLSVERIIELCLASGLESIEWGADIHLPPDNLKKAEHVRQMTLDAGLFSSAYGSYYRPGDDDSASFEAILDVAETLGAPIIRVWAGSRSSQDADERYWQTVIDNARRIVEQASERNIIVSLEHHENTLADTPGTTMKLLNAIQSDYMRSHWQPPHSANLDSKKESLSRLLAYVTNIHVFHWNPSTRERYALQDGSSDWAEYINMLRGSSQQHVLSLEFVRADSEEQFLADAKTLQTLLAQQP